MKLYYTEEETKFNNVRNACFILLIISSIYFIFDIWLLFAMPSMNGIISRVEYTASPGKGINKIYYLTLHSGQKNRISKRLYDRVKDAEKINYRSPSLWASVDGKSVRLLRLYPILFILLAGFALYFIFSQPDVVLPIAIRLYKVDTHPIPIIGYIGAVIFLLGIFTDF